MSEAYYNEFDPNAAQWLRNLQEKNLIAKGVVDERSIKSVTGADLAGYKRAHFFAGIGGWDLALKLAGWYENEEVWSGSCPCQPFSTAGKGKGTADERHLWPEFRRLIATCLPATVLGEQVASSAGRQWLASVRFDLENIQYWRTFHENLHEVLEASAAGRLPEILGEVIRRTEAAVPGLPEKIRVILAAETQGTAAVGEGKAARQGQDVAGIVQPKQSGELPLLEDKKPVSPQRAPIRLGQTSPRIECEDIEGNLRDQWDAVALGRRENGLQQPLLGPDYPFCRLCLREHQGGLLCHERRDGKLGIGEDAGNNDGVAWEKINDERGIAEAFGKIITLRVGRQRILGIQPLVEALGYAVGAADISAAGVGAPHIRQRLWWVATIGRLAENSSSIGRTGGGNGDSARDDGQVQAEGLRAAGGMGDGDGDGRNERRPESGLEQKAPNTPIPTGGIDGMDDPEGHGRSVLNSENLGEAARKIHSPSDEGHVHGTAWSDYRIIPCTDGKARRTGARVFPLAYGLPRGVGVGGSWRKGLARSASRARNGMLKGSGNAIVPELAAEFIRAYMESRAPQGPSK